MQLDLKVKVQPGEEKTVCKNFAIPSGTFNVGRFEAAMTAEAHHLLVYQMSFGASEVTDEVIDNCDEDAAAQAMRSGFVFGSQNPEYSLQLPQGYAYTPTGGFSMQLEFHIFNSGDVPLDAEAALNMYKAAEPVTGDAGVILFYHPLIVVPPMETAMARQRCPIAQDIELMNLIPHMHRHGTGMQISLTVPGTAPKQIVDAQSWHAQALNFDPPITIPAHSDIDYQCEYENNDSDYVIDGTSAAHNEMCVTGGVYLAKSGTRMTLNDELCFGKNIIYSGTQSCDAVRACEAAIDWTGTNPDGKAQYRMCRVAACQQSGDAFALLDSCRRSSCKASCYTLTGDEITGSKYDDAACTTCMASYCSAESASCSGATCP
jgi:hypothetical protein